MQTVKEMFRKTNMFLSSHHIYKIIRILLLVVYGCALPLTIIFAMYSGLLVDYAASDRFFWLMIFYSFLIPISIVIAMIMSIRFKKNIWLLLPIISVAGLLIVSQISSIVQENNYLAKQPIPFSERGLPPPATDVPVILPPDSGEAGKATLAGIDSDHDGVRDDLEREIVYMYPQNQEVRQVLTAMVKDRQEFITNNSGDAEVLGKLSLAHDALWRCYNQLLLGLKNADNTKITILLNMETNTSERRKKDNENGTKADSYTSNFMTSISPNPKSCEEVQGQY